MANIEPSHNTSHLKGSSAFAQEKIELKGDRGINATLILQTFFPRRSHIINCPPGFKFDNKKQKCVCNVDAHLGLYKCDHIISRFLGRNCEYDQ